MLTASAQRSIVETNKSWNIARCVSNGDVCITEVYKFGSNIDLEGMSYTEVIYSEGVTSSNWSSVGFLREDAAGKVFFRLNAGSSEVLLYDFSLTVGCVVELPSVGYGQCCSSTTTVDSVKVINYQGVERKTLFVSSKNLNGQGDYGKTFSVWIEGVGSMFGLLQPTDCLFTGSYSYLLCSSVADQLIYQRSQISGCKITAVDNENVERSIVVTSDANNLVVTNNSPDKVAVFLFSIDGKLQCSLTVSKASTEFISKSNLSKGICLVSVITNANVLNEKIVIR